MVKNIRSANNVRLTGHHVADPIGSSVTLIFMYEAGRKLKNRKKFAYYERNAIRFAMPL